MLKEGVRDSGKFNIWLELGRHGEGGKRSSPLSVVFINDFDFEFVRDGDELGMPL
jgi:hypothetical protein